MRVISILAVCVFSLTALAASACDYGVQSLHSYVPVQRVRVQQVYVQPVQQIYQQPVQVQQVEVNDHCYEPVQAVRVQRVRVQQVYTQPVQVYAQPVRVQQVYDYGVQSVQVHGGQLRSRSLNLGVGGINRGAVVNVRSGGGFLPLLGGNRGTVVNVQSGGGFLPLLGGNRGTTVNVRSGGGILRNRGNSVNVRVR